MARPRNTIRTIKVHLALPDDLVAEVNLFLFSELEQMVPRGKLSEFFTTAARNLMRELRKEKQNA